jgi:hypothetical protein
MLAAVDGHHTRTGEHHHHASGIIKHCRMGVLPQCAHLHIPGILYCHDFGMHLNTDSTDIMEQGELGFKTPNTCQWIFTAL